MSNQSGYHNSIAKFHSIDIGMYLTNLKKENHKAIDYKLLQAVLDRSNNLFRNYLQGVKLEEQEKFNPKSLSIFMHALASINKQPKQDNIVKSMISQDLKNNWFQNVTNNIKDFNSQELANSIYALAVLNFIPSKEFIIVWENAACLKMKNFNAQEENVR
jgi:hypothetical protein